MSRQWDAVAVIEKHQRVVIKDHGITSIVCTCNQGWTVDYPKHLVAALVTAGLLAHADIDYATRWDADAQAIKAGDAT